MTFALYSQKKARFGIKVGANYSTISNMNLDPQWGLLIGAFVNIQHSSFYAMQPELMYSRQGGRSSFEGSALTPRQTGEGEGKGN